MEYDRVVTLKNGRICHIRNGNEGDAQQMLKNMYLTHGQTDFLLSYPDEQRFDIDEEAKLLGDIAENEREAILLALVDNELIGSAGIMAVGTRYKQRHRAELGIGIDKDYWGQGIGRELLLSCIECAKHAGYAQLELNVVSDNERAVRMYENAGFTEFGRNPKGYNSRISGFQEIMYMRLEL